MSVPTDTPSQSIQGAPHLSNSIHTKPESALKVNHYRRNPDIDEVQADGYSKTQ